MTDHNLCIVVRRRDVKCRRCGEWYTPGQYDEHTRSLAHQRQLRLDRRMRERAGGTA